MSDIAKVSSGLVGRAEEVGELTSLMERVGSGGAQVLLIEGEAGIGKSALVRAAEGQARQLGFRVLPGRADELAGRRSFGLVTDCLGALNRPANEGRLLPGRHGPGAPAAPLAESGRTEADAEFHASEAAIEALDRLCAAGPVALILEDLHWADPSSLYVLRRLVRHVAPLPLVVLGTLRPLPRASELAGLLADLGDRRRLLLGPLDGLAVEQLVAGVVGGPPGPHLRAQAALAGGNPLFVLELLDALRAEGALRRRPGGAGPVVEVERAVPPPSLRLTVLHRLSFLTPDTLHLLSLAAVLGVRFRPAHLGALASRPAADLVAPLREALAAGLLTENGEALLFRHELVREALYGDLPLALRAGLHRDAARVLSRAGAPAGLLAEHLLRGAEPGDEEAVGRLQEAARELAGATPSVAVGLLERAIELAGPRSPAAPELLADLAVALLWSGRSSEGEATCRQALFRCSDAARRTALRQCLVESLLHRGQAATVLSEVDLGLRAPLIRAQDRSRLKGVAALARLFLGDLDGARAEALEVELAGQTLGDAALGSRAFIVQALLAEQEGRVLAAGELAGRAVALAEEDGSRGVHDSVPHLTQAMFLADADRFEEAAALLNQGREIQESLGARDLLPVHHVGLGFTRFWSGQWDEAMAEIETGIALAEETGAGWRAAARGLRAVVALAQGERPTAERWLRVAEAELAAGEAGYRIAWLAWAQALWLEDTGELAAAVDVLRPLFDGGRPSVILATTGPTTARLALAVGRRSLADSLAEALDDLARINPGATGIAAAATMVRGLLAGNPQLLAAAAVAYREAHRPLELALAAEEAALAAARVQERADAREMLMEALRAYGEMNAATFAARASRRLAELGVRVRRSDLVPSRPVHGWRSLTATEERVLRLVFERRSNPEIALALVMSRRTVETHVSNILSKVGLRSRAELAEDAARHFGWRLRFEEIAQDGEQS